MISLGLALGAVSASATTIVYDWSSTTTGNSIVNAASNWIGGSGSPQSSENAELRFGSAVTTSLVLNTSLDVSKLKFTGAFPSYTLEGSGSYNIDSGGILLESSGTGSVTISTAISLRASQTWTTNRALTVSGISSPSSTSFVLTKDGSESLTLSEASTFSGGLTVSAGTLILGSNTGAGTGTLTLRNGTILTSNGDARTITNHIHVEGSTVQFGTSSSSGDLVLSGSTEFQNSGTTTISGGGARVQFGQLESENSNTQLVFTGDNAFVLGGSLSSRITSITAGTTTTTGGVLFANSNAIHSGLTITGGKTGSYVGVVESAFANNTSGAFATFMSRISASTFAGTLGLDSPSTASPLTYLGGTDNAINLSGFIGSNFEGLGSGTYAVIGSSAVITPPSGGGLKLSGVRGGILKVDAPLSSTNSVTSVRINDNSAETSYGAVILSSSSSNYTNGTLLKAGYLLFGANSTDSAGAVTGGPLGTGGLNVNEYGSTGYLAATTSGLTLHNAIALGSESYSTLKLGISTSTPSAIASVASNTFTLAGVISGDGDTKIYIQNKDGAITLSGANTYTGTTDIASASLIAAAANALGSQAKVMFQGNSTLTVSTPTLSIGTLDSATSTSSTIALGSNSLAIYQNNAGTYRGDITGSGSVSKHNSGDLTLANATSYTGGTTVHSGKVILASGATLGASTSTITLNSGASLIANSGATISNPLTLNSGSSIGGAGTFATNISVGSGVTLSPGSSPGTMTFSSGLTFASGGTLAFEIRDANTSLNPGASTSWDLLSISGTLAVNASSASPFTIQVKSLNSDFNSGNAANFNASTNYAWKFAGATSITGFEANAFTIDRSGFTNSSLGSFFVSQSGNDLLLNFTPVPEPETYVLMGTGLSLLAAAAWRRRRS